VSFEKLEKYKFVPAKLDYSDKTTIIIEVIIAIETVVIVIDKQHTPPK